MKFTDLLTSLLLASSLCACGGGNTSPVVNPNSSQSSQSSALVAEVTPVIRVELGAGKYLLHSAYGGILSLNADQTGSLDIGDSLNNILTWKKVGSDVQITFLSAFPNSSLLWDQHPKWLGDQEITPADTSLDILITNLLLEPSYFQLPKSAPSSSIYSSWCSIPINQNTASLEDICRPRTVAAFENILAEILIINTKNFSLPTTQKLIGSWTIGNSEQVESLSLNSDLTFVLFKHGSTDTGINGTWNVDSDHISLRAYDGSTQDLYIRYISDGLYEVSRLTKTADNNFSNNLLGLFIKATTPTILTPKDLFGIWTASGYTQFIFQDEDWSGSLNQDKDTLIATYTYAGSEVCVKNNDLNCAPYHRISKQLLHFNDTSYYWLHKADENAASMYGSTRYSIYIEKRSPFSNRFDDWIINDYAYGLTLYDLRPGINQAWNFLFNDLLINDKQSIPFSTSPDTLHFSVINGKLEYSKNNKAYVLELISFTSTGFVVCEYEKQLTCDPRDQISLSAIAPKIQFNVNGKGKLLLGWNNPGDSNIHFGNTPQFKLQPTEGHRLKSVSGCNGNLSTYAFDIRPPSDNVNAFNSGEPGWYTTEKIIANCTITVNFEPKSLTLSE